MGNSFITAKIKIGKTIKDYYTLQGFKKGLKANLCPYTVDDRGLFTDVDGEKLFIRHWNFANIRFSAFVLTD